MSFITVLMTTASEDEAIKIVHQLLKEKLIACANIIERVHSVFWWQGSIKDSYEAMVIMKTRSKLLSNLMKTVKALHSYEVPEIIALPIVGGAPLYLGWVKSSTRKV
jgi:periplasmic divalent cation tolerance protein